MVTFSVTRCDPAAGGTAYSQEYSFEARAGMTVLEGLIHIQEQIDPTLAFRSSCRSALCGSCAMHIGGKYGLACQTQIGITLRHGVQPPWLLEDGVDPRDRVAAGLLRCHSLARERLMLCHVLSFPSKRSCMSHHAVAGLRTSSPTP